MPFDRLLPTAARLFLGAAMFAAFLPFASGGAEARGVKIGAAVAGAKVINRSLKANAAEDGEQSGAADAETSDADKAANADKPDEKAIAKANVVTPVVKPTPAPRLDADVAGCAPGMLCTVCIAGCNAATNVIVHSSPRPIRRE